MVNSNMCVHFMCNRVSHTSTQRRVAILKPEEGIGILPNRTVHRLDTEHGRGTSRIPGERGGNS